MSFLLLSHTSTQMRMESPVKTLMGSKFHRSAGSYAIEDTTLNCSPLLFYVYTLLYANTRDVDTITASAGSKTVMSGPELLNLL